MHAFGFRLRANVPEGQKRFPISKLAKNAIPFELVVVGSYADCEQHLMEELRRYGEVIGGFQMAILETFTGGPAVWCFPPGLTHLGRWWSRRWPAACR